MSDAATGSATTAAGMSAASRPPFPAIVGCPRSGTSLLAVMLDAHPALAMPPVAAAVRVFYDLYAASENKRRAGEKTPDNIFVMREIAAVLPEAHFIHVLRDPRDTALSWRKTW